MLKLKTEFEYISRHISSLNKSIEKIKPKKLRYELHMKMAKISCKVRIIELKINRKIAYEELFEREK